MKMHYKLRVEQRCRMCQRPSTVRVLTRHHIVPQTIFRSRKIKNPHAWSERMNTNPNVVPLCRPCHDLIDMGDFALRVIWRRMLRRLLLPGEIGFARRVMGDDWLDEQYPKARGDLDEPLAVKNGLHPILRRVRSPRVKSTLHLPGCDTSYCMYGCPVYRDRGSA